MRKASLVVLGVVLVCAAWCATAAARADAPTRSATPPPDEGGSGAASDQGSAAAIPPELQSAWIVRVYKVRPAKLFKGLVEALQAEGFPPEETDEARRTVKTSFVDFKQDDYDLQVGEPPPRIGGGYQLMQLIKIKAGKVSLTGEVAQVERGTELRVKARILVMALDRVKRVRLLVDRRSTGVVESEFILKLEARLGLEHL